MIVKSSVFQNKNELKDFFDFLSHFYILEQKNT